MAEAPQTYASGSQPDLEVSKARPDRPVESQTIGNPLELAVWTGFAKPSISDPEQGGGSPKEGGLAQFTTMVGVVNRLQNFIMSRKRNNLVKAYDELPASVAAQQAKFDQKKIGIEVTEVDSPAQSRLHGSKASPRLSKRTGLNAAIKHTPTKKLPPGPPGPSPRSGPKKLTTVKEFSFSTRNRVRKEVAADGFSRGSFSDGLSPRGSFIQADVSPRGSTSQSFAVPAKQKKMFMQELSSLRSGDDHSGHLLGQELARGKSSCRSLQPSSLVLSRSPSESRDGLRTRSTSFDDMPQTIVSPYASKKPLTPRKPAIPSPKLTNSPSLSKLSPLTGKPRYMSASLTSPLTHLPPSAVSPSKTSSHSPPSQPSPSTSDLSSTSRVAPPPPSTSSSPQSTSRSIEHHNNHHLSNIPENTKVNNSTDTFKSNNTSRSPIEASGVPIISSIVVKSVDSPASPRKRSSSEHDIVGFLGNASQEQRKAPLPPPPPSLVSSVSVPTLDVTPSTPKRMDGEKEEWDGVLPPELVYGILQFFDVSDLASATRVCRQWAILAEADPLWRELNERVRPKVLSKLEVLAREQPDCEPFLFTPVFPQRWKDAVRDTCLHSTAKPVSEDYVAMVVDTGVGSYKFGLVGAAEPRVIPAALGFPVARADPSELPPITRREGQVVLQKYPAFLAGADLPRHRGSQRYDVHAIFNSQGVGDSDDLSTIWAYMFDSLHVDPAQHPVLSSVPLHCPLNLQASHLEMLFETFGVPAAHLELSPLLAAYGHGSATGLVVDLGASSTQLLPICDGVVLQHATNKVRYLGGRTRASLMRSLLNTRGGADHYYESTFAREVTEKIARVSLQALAPSWDAFADQRPTMQEQSSVSLVMGEALFAPSWILDDQEMNGLPQLVMECLSKCAIDIRPRLLGNVMLCGGGANIPGVTERLQHELEGLFPAARGRISILHDPDPTSLSWRGGCVLAAHPAFQSSWMLKEDYDEGISDKWTR